MSEKLLLLLLANFADDNDEAWPSIDRLMGMTGASRATVHRLLASLEGQGLIARQASHRRTAHGSGFVKGTAIIRLLVPDDVHRRRVGSGLRPIPAPSKIPSESQCLTGETLREVEGSSCLTSETRRVSLVRLAYKEEPPLGTTRPNPPAPRVEVGVDVAPVGLGRVGDVSDERQGVLASSGAADAVDVLVEASMPDSAADAVAAEPECSDVAGRGSGADSAASEGLVQGSSRPDAIVVSDGPSGASEADWLLARSCLPKGMQALDGPGVARVAGVLRQRIEAGWSHRLLRETLAGNALPPQVWNLTGLVLHRLSQIPVEAAPVDRQSVSVRMAATDRPGGGPVGMPAWMRARREAVEAGRPEGQRSALWWATHFNQESGELEGAQR